jgi:hypothetical protein
MERVQAKMMVWKVLYDEVGRVNAQLAAALDCDPDLAGELKTKAVRLAMRSDAALQAVHDAMKERRAALPDGQR